MVEAVAESRGHEAGCWAMFDFTGTASHFLVARWAVDSDPLAPHDGLAICGRSGVVKLKSLERHPHEHVHNRRYCGNCLNMLRDHVARAEGQPWSSPLSDPAQDVRDFMDDGVLR